jgi:hypothetical protein
MAQRKCKNWLQAFVQHASSGEAPLKFYWWVGVSTLAGALRRRVWIDQKYFEWTPNQYIILVAPPGIVSKSTTASIGMNLLREVQGINFGPDVVTWQKLVEDMGKSKEQVLDITTGEYTPMSCLTISASEFGTLLNPQDREMTDVLVSLWDGQRGVFKKGTKTSGNDEIENPWINIIACTTPAWIAGNFPEYMIGGGFTSRCVFVYASAKRQFIAYPADHVPANFAEQKADLIHDLELISLMFGEMTLDDEAKEWGELWYMNHWKSSHKNLPPEQFGGYLARKQTHIHKLAMIISAAESDEYIITRTHLSFAADMVDALEHDMPYVFDKIGRTASTQVLNDLNDILKAYNSISQQDLYRMLSRKCTWTEFTEIISSAVNGGFAKLENRAGVMTVYRGAPRHHG